MTPPRSRDSTPKVRVRILSGSEIAIGPGKADLLRAVAETGSISAAAREMRMSYRRAWLLVHTMNSCFAEPLVDAVKGGPTGGGAELTAIGEEVLAIYDEISSLAGQRFESYLSPRGKGAPKRRAR